MNATDNIVLIGMPGVGKSTVGVLLAKAMSRSFVDTDVVIQAGEGRRLQDIIDTDGMDAFCAIEERRVLALACRRSVIATGGSVVYSAPAMRHLKASGVVVHLDLSLDTLKKRLTNLDSRGLVMGRDQTLEQLFHQRDPLYHEYADFTIDCENLTHEQVVERIVHALDP